MEFGLLCPDASVVGIAPFRGAFVTVPVCV
jgi:hypothetical protein